jgi:hypothetical protein
MWKQGDTDIKMIFIIVLGRFKKWRRDIRDILNVIQG